MWWSNYYTHVIICNGGSLSYTEVERSLTEHLAFKNAFNVLFIITNFLITNFLGNCVINFHCKIEYSKNEK